jgi:hypothetical protein
VGVFTTRVTSEVFLIQELGSEKIAGVKEVLGLEKQIRGELLFQTRLVRNCREYAG